MTSASPDATSSTPPGLSRILPIRVLSSARNSSTTAFLRVALTRASWATCKPPGFRGRQSPSARSSTRSTIAARTVDQEEWQVKVDHHFSARDTAWFRFSKLDQAGQSSGGRAGLVNSNEMDAVNFSGSYVHIFSPSMTGQFQFGRSISDIPTFREFEGLDAAAIAQQAGFPSGIFEYRDGPVLSGISAANYFGGTPVITTNRPANNYQIKGDMSVVKGKHTLRFGGDFMFATMSRTQASHGVTFTELATGDLANSATTGDSIASMILNYAESSSRRNIVESLRFGGNQGVYFQDSWKATPKLTVNLGLRFDYAWVPQYGTVEDGNIYTGNANTDTGQYAVIKVPGSCAELGGAPCIPTPDGRLPENVISVGEDSVLFPGRGRDVGPPGRDGLPPCRDDHPPILGWHGIRQLRRHLSERSRRRRQLAGRFDSALRDPFQAHTE